MLLNTQPENQRAAALYRAEGFRLLPDRLEVLAPAMSAVRVVTDSSCDLPPSLVSANAIDVVPAHCSSRGGRDHR